MNYLDLIYKKRSGLELHEDEIKLLVRGIIDGSMSDYQISAWAMAVYFQGMSAKEIRDMTINMAYSGDVVNLEEISGVVVDKHSTGGVGDNTTLVSIFIVAAAGVPVAKMSGRGLGHTGGTIDKFESIPGFKVERRHEEFIKQVKEVKVAVVSQSGNLVPADKRLYAIRDLTATVDSIPLIATSVMSKKIASGAGAIVLDVKTGNGAFMQSQEKAVELAKTMVEIGKAVKKDTIAIISNMDQPLGNMVGNSLEVKEAIDTLKGQGPDDLKELSLVLAAHMLSLGKKGLSYEEALEQAQVILNSGAALKKFEEMIVAQEGKLDLDADFYALPQAKIKIDVLSPQSGYIHAIDARQIGEIAMMLGAGRQEVGQSIDYSAGIELKKKVGDTVEKGEKLAIIHTNKNNNHQQIVDKIMKAYLIKVNNIKAKDLILEIIN